VDALFFLRFFNLSLTLSSSEESSFKFRPVLDVQPFLGLLLVNKPAMVPKTLCFRLPSFAGLYFVTGEPFGSGGFSPILIVLTSGRRFGLVFRFVGSGTFVNRSFSTTSTVLWSSLLESSWAWGLWGSSVPDGIVWSEIECAGGMESEYGCEGPETECPASEDLRSDCPCGGTRAICEAE
jgi:hypothetical protein